MAANRWDQLLEHWDRRLRTAFLQMVQDIKDQAHLEQIVRMLRHDDVEGALRAVGLDPALARVWNAAFERAFEAGGISTADGIPTRYLDRGFRLSVRFDVRNPLAEYWLRTQSAQFVTEVFDDQRQMIRDVLRNGMARGANPREVALDLVGRLNSRGHRFGGKIGLTQGQAGWVRQYSTELVTDPASALLRKLRDKRFDAAIRSAIAEERPIPADLRRKMVTAYENRALRYRVETIARTEAMNALHQAQETAMQIAVQQGAIDETQIAFIWRTARDNRVRDTHRSMNGQRRALGDAFVTGSGARLRFPGDHDGPASEIINCRCWREPKVDFLAGVR